MSKNKNLLKEAIADAKAVRETALANAKLALEEAFTPKLKSMLAAKIQQEMDGEEMDGVEDEEEVNVNDVTAEGDDMDADDVAMDGEVTEEEMDFEDETSEDEMPVAEDEDMEAEEDEMPVAEDEDMEEDELDLEEIIRELEGEAEEDELPVAEEDEDMEDEEEGEDMEDEEAPVAEEEDMDSEEEIDIQEVINALREMDDEDEMNAATPDEGPALDNVAEVKALKKELKEAYSAIQTMRSTLAETNLLNAKLLFSNKLFRTYSLNESQKVKVIENFDRAKNLREVKLVFATLSESFTIPTKKIVKESVASRPVGSTAPKKTVLTEGADLAARFKKLAGINKK